MLMAVPVSFKKIKRSAFRNPAGLLNEPQGAFNNGLLTDIDMDLFVPSFLSGASTRGRGPSIGNST
jgi:hypothetical protein